MLPPEALPKIQQLGLTRSTIQARTTFSPPRIRHSSHTMNERSVQQVRSRRRGPIHRVQNESAPPQHANERSVCTRHSYLAQGESMSSPANCTSIHDTARIPSISTGYQQSQNSEQSIYNMHYHQNRHQHNNDDNDEDSDDDQALRNNLDDSRINPRICICDRQLYPTDCSNCNVVSNSTCGRHKHISCTHG